MFDLSFANVKDTGENVSIDANSVIVKSGMTVAQAEKALILKTLERNR